MGIVEPTHLFLPGPPTPRDLELIKEAEGKCWELINEYDADTEEGRKALHDIAIRKYHYDEAAADMI